jgi:mannose-6-phosphate isomerase
MAIERARVRALPRPWGVVDLMPWSNAGHSGVAIGELWYERPAKDPPDPSLLLKLLFTSEALSIQVHPDDALARSMGLPNGKTEPWYVLSAAPGAKIALGLKHRLTQQQLRGAVEDGTVANLVAWQNASADDVIFVPAGTIHAIGGGLVIAEIQQRSDATFRLFDYGRRRELHIESAIAAAKAEPAHFRVRPNRLTDQRMLLVSNSYFVLERIDLAPASHWCLEAKRETWFLVLSGGGVAGSFDVAPADAVFAQSDRIDIHAGTSGMVGLAAYTGIGPVPHLLRRLAQPGPTQAMRQSKVPAPTSLTGARAASTGNRPETPK